MVLDIEKNNIDGATRPSEFSIEDEIKKGIKDKKSKDIHLSISGIERFRILCAEVHKFLENDWRKEKGNEENIITRQKKALIGVPDEVKYFKDLISKYIEVNSLSVTPFPDWYDNLSEAIFHEVWGLAGVSPWMKMKNSTSAKIIGSRIYFMIGGKMVLQKQTISPDRFQALKKALLLDTPEISQSKANIEILMYSGERVTIYDEPLTKRGQPIIVFRKYIMEKYNLQEQASRGTIPKDSIKMFESLAKVGFNVLFCGAVRTAKTTMLTIFQMLEDPILEGVFIESNPEVPFHELMPDSPIMQLVVDGDDLKKLSKQLMRSDADYIICGEARDGEMLSIMVDLANRGTRHCKSTVHLTDPHDLPFDIANMIVNEKGGNLNHTIVKVAKSFHYIFEFIQLKDRSKKRLKGVYELRYDNINYKISIHQILKYDFKTDRWTFDYSIGNDKENIAEEENYTEFEAFKKELKMLSKKYPMKNSKTIIPFYSKQ